jgi:hypothetical protein
VEVVVAHAVEAEQQQVAVAVVPVVVAPLLPGETQQ